MDRYNRISEAINKTIKPRDPMEEIWVDDIVYFEWMILRIRRCEAAALNWRWGMPPGTMACDLREKSKNLLPKNEEARVEFLNLVAELADDSDVEGFAIKTSAADLERLHRILRPSKGVVTRRSAALPNIAVNWGGNCDVATGLSRVRFSN